MPDSRFFDLNDDVLRPHVKSVRPATKEMRAKRLVPMCVRFWVLMLLPFWA